ncbi:1-acyl-sn-glycerol-3-phosphate acyltransferase [Neokomagataea thailandica NBRC 106555]|uniref:1-acyl-sn-glycerol-3-phosphate acyltransferase n=2 Tax=Neokomagataea TaxID=1223423 RepID=A0A4Y6V2T4_9PROT|nr:MULTISPECIES: lysophospholipid acyltransferase family protein [Neokomagataea]QDH24293.1 1-acyl-sn-glycerol-3-phosphate acyltransferase [Neokomagataea tanensis]GBR53058.1 1-acyl-sn-glycerol-3-phosphate acyltransferase [Neokomagataea thailandica NBRC 106555]
MAYRNAGQQTRRRPNSRPVLSEDELHAAHVVTTRTTRTTRMSRSFCIGRLISILITTFWLGCVQTLLVRLPGSGKIRLARFYWASVARILGLKVRVVGQPAGGIRTAKDVQNGARPVVYVANHTSWLDIATMGGVIPTVFVAKGEVSGWPLIGIVSRLGRSIFVSRNRQNTGRELEDMSARLWAGDDIMLFPEGTSSDGTRVLPFLSSFFAVAKPGRLEQAGMPKPPPVLIQPVSLVYDRLEGLPVGRMRRKVFSWFGDMDLAPHVWAFGQWRTMRATVLFHPPIDPEKFRSRKVLAQEAYKIVENGATEIRRGRVGRAPGGEAVIGENRP